MRRVQFSTISRIDSLVDVIFEEFKGDYYPGESVTVELQDKTRLNGVVRDKTRFNSRTNPDGTVEPAYSRYFVTLSGGPDSEQEAYVDEAHIWRDRRVFTKAALRSFIKRTVTRESWNGAPWLVKHEFATKYHIDTRVPPHLQYDNKVQERKYQLALKRLSEQGVDVNGQQNGLGAGPVRLPELKPAPKTQKGKQLPVLQQPQLHRFIPESGASPTAPLAPPNVPSGHGLQFPVPLRGNLAPPQPFRVFEPPPLPPPPPPKYPIEDLQLEPREGNVRPSLKFLCCDPPAGVDAPKPTGTVENIKMESVGPLLETWDTLNVYCEVFMLDSFTFDDFVEAMHIYSDSTPCELFTEIHCAVLKILVKSEADGGKVQIQLPELEEEEEEEEEEPEETEVPEPEPEPQPVGRATRSSIAKLEAERLAAEMAAAEKEREALEKEDKHRAAELLQDFDWIEQLQKREFANGGWEMIIVGLLYHLSKWERYTPRCEEILVYLVPLDVEPSRETVRQKYASSDINFRVKVLQIICMLTTETKAIRGYMEDCSEQMTAYRKEKIEHQKARKQA